MRGRKQREGLDLSALEREMKEESDAFRIPGYEALFSLARRVRGGLRRLKELAYHCYNYARFLQWTRRLCPDHARIHATCSYWKCTCQWCVLFRELVLNAFEEFVGTLSIPLRRRLRASRTWSYEAFAQKIVFTGFMSGAARTATAA